MNTSSPLSKILGHGLRSLLALGVLLLQVGACSSGDPASDGGAAGLSTAGGPGASAEAGASGAASGAGASSQGGELGTAGGSGGSGGTGVGGDSSVAGAGGASAGAAGEGSAMAGAGGSPADAPVQHEFMVIDNNTNRLFYVNEFEPETNWDIAIPAGGRELELLETSVLVSHSAGAVEYDLTSHESVWQKDGLSSIQTAHRLANGNTLLGQSGANTTFLEVSPAGDTVNTITVSGVAELRLARMLDSGNLLFTGDSGGFKVFEADQTGTVLWDAPLTGKGYVAHRLPDGNTLATTGETATVIEIAPDDTVVATRGGPENFAELELLWFSGFQLLDNGNVVVANWHGHEQEASQGPHLVELTAGNTSPWQWSSASAVTVTNVLVIR